MVVVDLDLRKSVSWIGTPKPLFPLHLVVLSYQNRMGSAQDPFDVSADGKLFLVNSGDPLHEAEPINVIFNWDAKLKK